MDIISNYNQNIIYCESPDENRDFFYLFNIKIAILSRKPNTMKKIFGIAILAIIMACNQSGEKSKDNADSTQANAVAEADVQIKDKKKSEILSQYILLKDELVKSDAAAVQKSASALQNSLANYDGCEPTAEIAAKIASDTNLAAQRKHFTVLSADIIALLKNAELEKGTIYVQHCPMANKGDGGDWLSIDKKIRNPYYGDEMLECGSVVEEIAKK